MNYPEENRQGDKSTAMMKYLCDQGIANRSADDFEELRINDFTATLVDEDTGWKELLLS